MEFNAFKKASQKTIRPFILSYFNLQASISSPAGYSSYNSSYKEQDFYSIQASISELGSVRLATTTTAY